MSRTKSIYNETLASKYNNKDILSKSVDKILDYQWNFYEKDIFINCNFSGNKIPDQGWKIHVSCTLKNALDILNIVTETLIKEKVNFKYVKNTELLNIMYKKNFSRVGAGKFITIYPNNEEQFIELLEVLYFKLKDFEGPYVLSDRRYKDCAVLYYRYGGFKEIIRYDDEGKKEYLILDSDNEYIVDNRLAYYSPPKGQDEIISYKASNEQESPNDYVFKKALKFSNLGGVYLAEDINGENVIIKEARSYINYFPNGIMGTDRLKSEYNLLSFFSKHTNVPKALDFYKQWEHYFLVEEFIDGKTLYNFYMDETPILDVDFNGKKWNEYLIKICDIFIQITDILECIHDYGYIYGDLSPNNVMITEDHKVYLIDLESSININEINLASQTFEYTEEITSNNFFQSDIYSIGLLLLSCLINRNRLYLLDESKIEDVIQQLFSNYTFPIELKELIYSLIDADHANRPSTKEIKENLSEIKEILNELEINVIENNTSLKKKIDEVKYSVKPLLNGINSYREKSLSDVYSTSDIIDNPYNFSNGLLGIAYTKFKMNEVSSNDMQDIETVISESKYCPEGLYTGRSGIAWKLSEMGFLKDAEKIFPSTVTESSNLSLYSGLAGIGLANIYFYNKTGKRHYKKNSIKIADYIIRNIDLCSDIGFKKGRTGISLFLLEIYKVTNYEKYLYMGEFFLEYDMEYIYHHKSGALLLSTEADSNDFLSPYFIDGSAGILTVLARYYKVTGKEDYKEQCRRIADTLLIKHHTSPSLFRGLAGIANALYDCYLFLNEASYYEESVNLLRECLRYAVKNNNKWELPNRTLNYLCFDIAEGSAGVLLIIDRIINNGKINPLFFIDNTEERIVL